MPARQAPAPTHGILPDLFLSYLAALLFSAWRPHDAALPQACSIDALTWLLRQLRQLVLRFLQPALAGVLYSPTQRAAASRSCGQHVKTCVAPAAVHILCQLWF